MIKTAYSDFQRSLPPAAWNTLPGYEELSVGYQHFSSLVNDLSEDELTVAACSEAISKLPGYLNEWRKTRMHHLLGQLPGTNLFEDLETYLNNLSLATSLFTCTDCELLLDTKRWNCLFGWDEISKHALCPTLARVGPTNLSFFMSGSRLAADLIAFMGLDPATASFADMDRLNARFLCGMCTKGRGRHRRKIYTWREYVCRLCFISDDPLTMNRLLTRP